MAQELARRRSTQHSERAHAIDDIARGMAGFFSALSLGFFNLGGGDADKYCVDLANRGRGRPLFLSRRLEPRKPLLLIKKKPR